MGRERPDLRAGLRSFTVGSYLIIYRPLADGIEVVRVLHGARDLAKLV
jgi:toxin ParE1/3/4